MKKFGDLEIGANFVLADSIRRTANPAECTKGGAGIDIYRKVNILWKKPDASMIDEYGALLLSNSSVFEGFNPETEVIEVFI